MHKRLLALLMLIPITASAEPVFMKDSVGDRPFPPTWGVGFDFFTMNQDYKIEQLSFDLPGVSLPDSSQVKVKNDVQHFDFKADVWLFPFLNLFVVGGHVENDTIVDLSQTEIIGLPIALGQLDINSDGTVWGGGATLAYGTERWFTAMTSTYTTVDLGGDFDSKTKAFTLQPRVGLIRGGWMAWVGGMYLDVEETHSGVITIPGVGSLPFSATLGAADDWNAAVGTRYHFSERASISLELGFGGRDHTLFNYNFRF